MVAAFRRGFLLIVASVLFCGVHASAQAQSDVVLVDAAAPSHPFPHFWEKMFGSGRAVLSLRESYRTDMRDVKQITGFEYVRFHAIFHDELGVYNLDGQGRPVYNFSYIDQIYDGLLANRVKPFVELSFMPNKLAATMALHAFWYKQNISPPRDYGEWDALITAFTKHLLDRYGVDEVASWYFEVWNEPNIDFWVGQPKQATYWDLYDHTATAVKKVNGRLRVGGPSTAQAAWVDALIAHCAQNKIPLDFVSTHVYGNDTAKDVFGTDENIPRDKMVCRAVSKVHDQIKASSNPTLPLIWSEFNASYGNEHQITDALYMGPWLAETIHNCDGLVDIMSYWTFSDVFEEQGIVKAPFYGGFGLLAEDGIPKPAYGAFELLHKLGTKRLTVNTDSALVTTRADGSLVLALWNYAPEGQEGQPKTVTVRLKGTKAKHASIQRLDANHGDYHGAYAKMGSPDYPTQAQIKQLREAAKLGAPESVDVKGGEFKVTIPGAGLAVVELR